MVYLLHAHFGRDGREEAEALLQRRSGDADNPRILGAFNEPTPDWLSFFMFTFFTDRDGKYQLCSLAESGFDPLARTCRFMLTEEAHHMFVGESGIGRIVQRTCEAMVAGKTDDVAKLRAQGVIDLPTIQRYLNFHFSVTMDLFGSDVSSNAATFYTSGLKGRFEETKIDDDHLLTGATYPVLEVRDGRLATSQASALNALNEKLRDDFIRDAVAGIERWNKIIEKQGIPFRLKAPHKAFHRRIGPLAAAHVAPDGNVVSAAEWEANADRWLPSAEDRAFVASLMGRVVEPGKFANWIAPPSARRRQPAGGLRLRAVQLTRRRRGTAMGTATHGGRGDPPAPHRSGDLHPVQHLRGDLPRRRGDARRAQLCRRRERVQRVQRMHRALPYRRHRQLAARREEGRLHAGGATVVGQPAAAAGDRHGGRAGRPPDRRRAHDGARDVGSGRHGGAAVVGRASVRQPLLGRRGRRSPRSPATSA